MTLEITLAELVRRRLRYLPGRPCSTGLRSEGRQGEVSWRALGELGRLSVATAVASRTGIAKPRIHHEFIWTTVDQLAEYVASKTFR